MFGLMDKIADQWIQTVLALSHCRSPEFLKGARNKPFTSSGKNMKRVLETAVPGGVGKC